MFGKARPSVLWLKTAFQYQEEYNEREAIWSWHLTSFYLVSGFADHSCCNSILLLEFLLKFQSMQREGLKELEPAMSPFCE